MTEWFLFDLGNTVIRLAYERVIENICREASAEREELIGLLEVPGGYRDLERGTVSFWDFYEFVCENAGYHGSIRDFHAAWSDFFDGPVAGIEELLDEVRTRYRIAYLSNSNEVHEEVIPKQFASLFRKGERFIFSHRLRVAKPDPEFFLRALELLESPAQQVAFVDDLAQNVDAARSVGMQAFHFTDVARLRRELQEAGLI